MISPVRGGVAWPVAFVLGVVVVGRRAAVARALGLDAPAALAHEGPTMTPPHDPAEPPTTYAEFEASLVQAGAKLVAHQAHALYLGALTSTRLGLGPHWLLETVLGEDTALGETPEAAQGVIASLFGYWNTLVSELEAGRVHFAPTRAPAPADRDALRAFVARRRDELTWYVRGIDAGGDDPLEFGADGTELLRRLAEASGFLEVYSDLLAGSTPVPEDELVNAAALLGRTSELCEEIIADLMAVTDEVRREALATSVAMQGRQTDDGVRIGSAAPAPAPASGGCPCGSRRPWKDCCGRPDRLQ